MPINPLRGGTTASFLCAIVTVMATPALSEPSNAAMRKFSVDALSKRNATTDLPGRVLGENEEIDLAAALDMYTRNASYIMRLEDKTGSIEVGKRADLIVLDRNIFEIPVTEINEALVLLTIMDGRTVYSGL